MNEFTPKIVLEPTDKYQKAINDWNQFQQSFYELSPQDKNRFSYELQNTLMKNYMLNMFRQMF